MCNLLPTSRLMECSRRFMLFLPVWSLAVVALGFATPAHAADSAKPSVASAAMIWGLEFSPDGKWLAAATNVREHGGPIVIWRVEDWEPQVVRLEPTGGLDVAFSPDGKLLAYSTRTPLVSLLEVPSGNFIRGIKALDTEEGTVMGVAFAPDGESLLTAGTDGIIREWNLTDGSLRRTFEGHADTVYGIAVSPDGSLLLSGGRDHESRLWDMPSGKLIQVFKPGISIVRRVRFSPDGSLFLASSWDGVARIRETETRQLRAVLKGGSNSTAITRDNRLIATARHRTTANVYRVELAPASKEPSQRIRALLVKLDDKEYSVREAAAKAIAQIGIVAEPFLREALDSASPESADQGTSVAKARHVTRTDHRTAWAPRRCGGRLFFARRATAGNRMPRR